MVGVWWGMVVVKAKQLWSATEHNSMDLKMFMMRECVFLEYEYG